MDSDTLLQKYPNVSREELDKIRETSHYPAFRQSLFERSVSSLHKTREKYKRHGSESVSVGPLVQLLSAQFLSSHQDKSPTVFGRIHAEFRDPATGEIIVHDFYNRDRGDVHVLDSAGRLSLTTPDYSLHPFDFCTPLDRVTLVVDVCIGDNNFSAQFQCRGDVDDFQKVNVENIPRDFGTLVLLYNTIPFALQARVFVRFVRKEGYSRGAPPLNLNGMIVARSSDAFGSFTLFDKKTNEFEQLDFGAATDWANMSLSRSWVGISAHSSLTIDVDLSEYGTDRRILKESLEFQVQTDRGHQKFIVDDVLIDVIVAWYSPSPHGTCLDDESSGDEMSSSQDESDNEQASEPSGDERSSCEEQSDDEQMSEAGIPMVPSDFSRPRQLVAHQDIPLSSWALQIYSIFIGRERVRPLRIYGSIKVAAPPHTYNVFIKEASGACCLSEHRKTMPVQNGCGVFDESETLKIGFDLKDLSSELVIRGRVTWHWSSFNASPRRINKQLCSVVRGEEGFAAIHYSLFSEAVQAKIGLLWKRKDECVDVPLMVFGSLVARYNNYDYAPRYNKDYYRVCLFERNLEDPAQAAAAAGTSGVISLARDVVVVPIGSSLIVEANLFDAASNGGIKGSLEFRMGCSDPVMLEGDNHCIYAQIKWEEVGK